MSPAFTITNPQRFLHRAALLDGVCGAPGLSLIVHGRAMRLAARSAGILVVLLEPIGPLDRNADPDDLQVVLPCRPTIPVLALLDGLQRTTQHDGPLTVLIDASTIELCYGSHRQTIPILHDSTFDLYEDEIVAALSCPRLPAIGRFNADHLALLGRLLGRTHELTCTLTGIRDDVAGMAAHSTHDRAALLRRWHDRLVDAPAHYLDASLFVRLDQDPDGIAPNGSAG